MTDKQTPLIKQYNRIKQKHPDTILLYRLGDFFETFNEDAKVTAKVCGIALTKRNNGTAGDMPLAGFPHHQLDNYLPKLVRAGYRVAVCEQLEDPKKAKGIVKRDVVEVVTPGAALYDKLLDSRQNNYLAAVHIDKIGLHTIAGLAFTDISTGEFFITECNLANLTEILETFAPKEIIYSKSVKDIISQELENLSYQPAHTKLESWIFDAEFAAEAITSHFGTLSLKGFGIDNQVTAIASSGAIFHYLKETQRAELKQIRSIRHFNHSEFMLLDYSTRRNLEISFSMNDGNKYGSLIGILDETATPMGSRLLKKWIAQPLTNIEQISSRLDSVELIIQHSLSDKLKHELTQIGDLERLLSKICTSRANPRDLVSLKHSIGRIPDLKLILSSVNDSYLNRLGNQLDILDELYSIIDKTIIDEPTVQLGTGSVFKTGYNNELDDYIEIKYNGKNWLNEYRDAEREKSNISSLKVGYTNVFGYYIEISHVHKSKVPDNYERRQTLTNAERYITPELKEYEKKILTAEERILELEQSLFAEILNRIILFSDKIQNNAFIIAQIDCLFSFALVSEKYQYVKPRIDDSDIININEGRHPVVERLLPIGESFQTNSILMDNTNEMIHIITGPNMAGKSCYLRQTALIVFIGQIGCFVPAKDASFGVVDRIFTRVGAQDNITAGESTFLVEMQETANIINNATRKSLILLDEVGRGTATFDGISLAWAITEYIHNIIRAKTLFATHYHELNELADRYAQIANYKIDVIESNGKLLFTHKVKKGGTDHSFGIHVAQLAGLPQAIIDRANEIMLNLEGTSSGEIGIDKSKSVSTKTIQTKSSKRIPEQLAIFEIKDDALREKILALNINKLSPLEALHLLNEFHNEVKKDSK